MGAHEAQHSQRATHLPAAAPYQFRPPGDAQMPENGVKVVSLGRGASAEIHRLGDHREAIGGVEALADDGLIGL